MTSKQDFTDEEWTRIRRAPLVAGVAISLADPGGPIEVAKETVAKRRRLARNGMEMARRGEDDHGVGLPTEAGRADGGGPHRRSLAA